MSTIHALATELGTAGYELGSGRAVPGAAALLGLAGVVAGGLGLRGPGRAAAVVAVLLGVVAVVVGGLHGANAAGGLGSGNGLAGAVAAVLLGLAGLVLGAFALVRTRRAG